MHVCIGITLYQKVDKVFRGVLILAGANCALDLTVAIFFATLLCYHV